VYDALGQVHARRATDRSSARRFAERPRRGKHRPWDERAAPSLRKSREQRGASASDGRGEVARRFRLELLIWNLDV
jgi:hypothetical protein